MLDHQIVLDSPDWLQISRAKIGPGGCGDSRPRPRLRPGRENRAAGGLLGRVFLTLG